MANESDRDNTLKNAFSIVRQTHIELAELYKDFEAELNKYNLVCIHNGSDVGTQRSTSLNNPEYWLFPYTARYFVLNKTDDHRNWYAGITMVHYNRSEDEPIIPHFLIGFVKKENPYPGRFEYWWIVSMYESDYDRKILDSNNKEVTSISDDEWHNVIMPKDEEGKVSENWYDEGYIYSTPLTLISNRNDVSDLAKKLIEKFNSLLNHEV